MKKIYYLLCLLPLMPLVSSCDDEEAEVVLLQNPERDLRMQARRQPDFPMCRCLIPVICRAVQA